MLTWAATNGGDAVKNTRIIAKGGDVRALRWAHEVAKLPWDESTSLSCAAGGHLDALVYALNRGCLFHDRTSVHAAAGGHLVRPRTE